MGKPESCSPPLSTSNLSTPPQASSSASTLVFYNQPDPGGRDPSKPGVCPGLQPLPSLLGTALAHLCSPENHAKPAGLGCHSGPQGKTERKREKKRLEAREKSLFIMECRETSQKGEFSMVTNNQFRSRRCLKCYRLGCLFLCN